MLEIVLLITNVLVFLDQRGTLTSKCPSEMLPQIHVFLVRPRFSSIE